MDFEWTSENIDEIKSQIDSGSIPTLVESLSDHHPADVADLIEQLTFDEGRTIIQELEESFSADVIIEIQEDLQRKLIRSLSNEEISDVVSNLDSDDAADVIGELPEEDKKEVLNAIEDVEQAKQIADLLTHAEDTAGALMATELIKVNENWTVRHCVREMRKQAENVEEVHTVYVVNDHNVVLGTLSLKKLLTTSTKTPVSEIFKEKVISVKSTTDVEEVAQIMEKYDLVVVPVVDEFGRLLGRITIDDVVDVIKEEAERDYNLASGITEDLEYNDSVYKITRARLPWLLIGVLGGLLSANLISNNGNQLVSYPALAFFMTLIAATGGNVGVQSSAIVVQALANNTFDKNLFKRLIKELMIGFVNGIIVAGVILSVSLLMDLPNGVAITISIAVFAVVIVASLFGTFVPIVLDRVNIDPALATGPFITTTNDVLGLFIYFSVARLILGI